jgi:hypothetical protein
MDPLKIKIPRQGKVNIDVLIGFLEKHLATLHFIYCDCSNFELSDRLLHEMKRMETVIEQLKKA